LFDIATPLYSADIRVRASLAEALRERVEQRDCNRASATDKSNLAICYLLGFGLKKSAVDAEHLLSSLKPNEMEAVTRGLERFKTTYSYSTYKESLFRTLLELGHLNPIDLSEGSAHPMDSESMRSKYETELVDAKQALGATHHIVCTLTANLSSLYYACDMLSRALSLQEALLEIYRHKYGEQSRHTDSAKINLACTCREDGQYDRAELLFKDVLIRRTKNAGEHSIDTLQVRSDLATMHLTRGRWQEAKSSLREVVQHSVIVLGSSHPHSIRMRGNLASALQNIGDFAEAETEQKLALATSTEVHGRTHISTITCATNLMSLYNDRKLLTKETADHLDQVKDAAQIAVDRFGTSHGFTLRIQSNIAQAYIDRGLYDEAKDILHEIANHSEKNKGRDHPDTIIILGSLFHVYYHQNDWNGAVELSLNLLNRMKEEQPDYPVILGNLACAYSKQGDMLAAVNAAKRAYEMQASRSGRVHYLTKLAEENLDRFQAALGSYAAGRSDD
jgi:tetratricopeptide (TPR) repeat protein